MTGRPWERSAAVELLEAAGVPEKLVSGRFTRRNDSRRNHGSPDCSSGRAASPRGWGSYAARARPGRFVRDQAGWRYYRHGEAAGVCTGPAGSHPIADSILWDRAGVIV